MTIRCAVLPHVIEDNPYQRLLHEALGRRGVEIVLGARVGLRLVSTRPRLTALHLHWVEWLINARRRGPRLRLPFTVLLSARLVAVLLVLRLRGTPVVWTVHNLRSHEAPYPRLERLVMRAVAALVTTIHVHAQGAADRVVEQLGVDRKKVIVGYHGNYNDAYTPYPGTKRQAREELGLRPDGFVFLVFGAVRPYKRVPEIIAAFREGGGSENAELVIAGRPLDSEYEQEIERVRDRDARIQLHLDFIPTGAVATYFAAADVAVLNYAEIFSSGALLLALSFGTPALAPALGTAREVAGPLAVMPFGPDGLAAAMQHVEVDPDLKRRREAASAVAARYDWDSLAEGLVLAYTR